MIAMGLGILAYRPFLDPLKVWDYWLWLLLPLCLGVSLVYKSVRVDSMRRVPAEAVKATFWIVVGMAAAAGALLLLVRFQAA
jgi:hypothetical protein